jgi:hypothetical protein
MTTFGNWACLSIGLILTFATVVLRLELYMNTLINKSSCIFKKYRMTLPLALTGLLTSCAGVTHQAITTAEQDCKARGVRYYDSSPYLLVQTDNQGGLTSDFMYLPDQNKKRQARPYTFLASNTTTLSFQNGILTDSSSDTDSSAVPAAVIKALEQVATSAAKLLAFDAAQTKQAPRVYLFKIVILESGVNSAEFC